ncbi:ABC transporter permease [Streptomyces sp. TRM 70361]|uniref:ABC transporter permease n=1 Tax=Streptomyces sp. TRM 70361 TaxID=3116553 RepID=UPI002E7BA5FB|nr:ABC transporter permease [Streptomyces sp. TRM 70361]MEE1938060.1 ABC transporter permease [Streptomyces sp. TRM 70361]
MSGTEARTAAGGGGQTPGGTGGGGRPGRTGRGPDLRVFAGLSKAMALGLLRDRAAVFFMLLFPLMFLVFLGALLKGDSTPRVEIVQIGRVEVLDALPAGTREELDDFLELRRSGDREKALEEVRAGDVDAVLWQHGDEVRLRYSAADPTRAGNVRAVVNSLVQQANIAATGQPPAYELTSAQAEDESMKAIQFLTPGLLGWAVSMSAVMGSALVLVNWRKKRILRRLWLAPVSAGSVIAARVGVTVALALVQTLVFIGVATLPYYGLELSGHWWLSLPLVVCGTLAFMSMGLVVGAWAKTEEAANGVSQLVVLPMAFLSGAFFPLEGTPAWVRTLSEIFPLKHLTEAMQDVLSRGQGWDAALPVMGGLLLFAVVLTAVAARFFRWDDA